MKINRFIHCILFVSLLPWILLFIIANSPMLLAAEPAIDDQFTSKVHAFRQLVLKNRGNWLSPSSPWASYIERQNFEGLSLVQQKRYLALQTEGQCEELLRFEKIGFLALHPEWSQALSDKIVKNIFSNEIAPARSFGFRRCQALAMLYPIIEKEKKLDPKFYYLTIPGTDLGNRLDKVYDYREIILRKAFRILFDLAACEDYKPAINDILKYYKLYLIFVGYRERIYFFTRANYYDLEAPDISTVVKEIRLFDLLNSHPRFALLPKIKTLQSFLEHGDLVAARKMTFNLTYISCGRSESE